MIQEFENPGAEWRGKPFWSWSGFWRRMMKRNLFMFLAARKLK